MAQNAGSRLKRTRSHFQLPLDNTYTPEVASVNSAPSMILPFLFLAAEKDALSEDFIKDNGITHVINVSGACQKCPFVPDENFYRIPVEDTEAERLLPFFHTANAFIDECREKGGCVLVHCLAGVSRSPTVVTAYIMHYLQKPWSEAYEFVKTKRPIIDPNFNFMAQLLRFNDEVS